ncbi:MAG: hypothetical protein J6X55_04225, partial [Victivallales bacterium]|nr:hypothetical protein [Victivallales bacterium]
VAAVAGGYYYYTHHKGEIDSKMKNAANQVQNAAKDVKKTVEDNTVNRESKYKKDRENLVK